MPLQGRPNREYGPLRELFFDAFHEGSALYELEGQLDKLARSGSDDVREIAEAAKQELAAVADLLTEDSELDQLLAELQDALGGEGE